MKIQQNKPNIKEALRAAVKRLEIKEPQFQANVVKASQKNKQSRKKPS